MENVAVLFVLDYSTSVNVRNVAGAFLTELASKENTNVKAAVIDYSAVAEATEWTTIDGNTDTSAETGLLKSKTSSGTNYHAGLLKAQGMLESEEIEGYTTYLITISDGITYLWTDETTNKTMTVPYKMEGNAGSVSDAHDGSSVWDMTYGEGTPLVNVTVDEGNITTEGAYGDFDAFFENMKGKIENTEEYFAVYKSEYTDAIKVYNSDYGTTYKELTAAVLTKYATNVEVAVYNTILTYKTLAGNVDYAYAFKMDEGNWTNYPWGEQVMDQLISASDNSGDIASGVISEDTASTVFSTIRDQILYEIMSGTVTDVIGEDFDWVGMDTVELTVGGVKVEANEIEEGSNVVTFGTADATTGEYPYVVTYYADNEETGKSEYLTWEINVHVEEGNGLTLSYDLELKDGYALPEGKSYEILPTCPQMKVR
ncbi:MAG: VWA domain-containing protein [Firmicutes bacterium]|nr:VWA domain-containing protein [Bacillota bacterium]